MTSFYLILAIGKSLSDEAWIEAGAAAVEAMPAAVEAAAPEATRGPLCCFSYKVYISKDIGSHVQAIWYFPAMVSLIALAKIDRPVSF